MIELMNNKIVLRESSLADAENIVKWRNKKDVKKYFFRREDITIESHTKWFLENVRTRKAVQFVIVYEDTPIGTAFLSEIDTQNNKAEFGFFIGDGQFRGKGIGTTVCKLVVKYAFEQMKLNRILMRMYEINESSYKVSKKAGFQFEGLLKEDALYDGKYINTNIMGIIKSEYDRISKDYI